jgi:hexosaminidase
MMQTKNYKPFEINFKSFYFFVILITSLFSFLPSSAQNKGIIVKSSELAISVAAVENNYQGNNQALVNFSLTNNSKSTLPASGWKIYFNIKSTISLLPEASGSMLERQKGNLFQLSPAKGFTPLHYKGKYSTQMLVENNIINKSDQPEGFYIVFDNDVNTGYNIKNVTVSPVTIKPVNGKLTSDFAETVYRRNALIKNVADENISKIFPSPLSSTITNSSFELNEDLSIIADTSFKKEAAYLSEELQKVLLNKPAMNAGESKNTIHLKQKKEVLPEGYELIVGADNITISASTAQGIFYGIQSLKTLLPAGVWAKKQKTITVPGINIKDAPRFGYRGFMLDVARDFQTKKEVLRILDLMALYKLNIFHFHLTDDEGWRLEIDGLPELTMLGSNRGHSLDEKRNMPAAYGSGGETGQLYGSGFFTKADFIEILKYAKERYITVIPEIETPGHARAAIKAMDARYEKYMQLGQKEKALEYFLRDTSDVSVYNTPQSFHDNVMNVALPSVYTFVEKVVTEISKLYQQADAPLTSIHLGGDEVPAGVWEKSPLCNDLIKNNTALQNTDDLWYYYLDKVNNILKVKGISLSGWEEIGLRKTILDGNKIFIPNPGFVNKDMHLYVWNNIGGNEDLAYKLANTGYKIILTCVTNFYFDMIQYKTYDEPGYYWGSVTDISKVFEFNPFDLLKNVKENEVARKQRITEYGKTNIMGLQGAVWGETIKGTQQLEYMMLPRLAALAERAWAKEPAWSLEKDKQKAGADFINDWSAFTANVGNKQLPLLDNYNDGYSYRIPPAGAVVEDRKVLANTQFPGLTIRYTTNGKEPGIESNIYTGPISEKGIIKLKVFNNIGWKSYTTVIENN